MIHATPIRRDAEGRYCLNDLHRAAGGEDKHGPKRWMANQATQDLVATLKDENPSIAPVDLSRGRYGGTYVHEDLAIDYAAWISPAFKLEVYRGNQRIPAICHCGHQLLCLLVHQPVVGGWRIT